MRGQPAAGLVQPGEARIRPAARPHLLVDRLLHRCHGRADATAAPRARRTGAMAPHQRTAPARAAAAEITTAGTRPDQPGAGLCPVRRRTRALQRRHRTRRGPGAVAGALAECGPDRPHGRQICQGQQGVGRRLAAGHPRRPAQAPREEGDRTLRDALRQPGRRTDPVAAHRAGRRQLRRPHAAQRTPAPPGGHPADPATREHRQRPARDRARVAQRAADSPHDPARARRQSLCRNHAARKLRLVCPPAQQHQRRAARPGRARPSIREPVDSGRRHAVRLLCIADPAPLPSGPYFTGKTSWNSF